MIYYSVPANLQDKPCYKRNSARKIPNGYYLIAHELLTERECYLINAPIDLLIKTEIKKSDCYKCFGARFKKGE